MYISIHKLVYNKPLIYPIPITFMMLKCRRCKNVWNYQGSRRGIQKASCSACNLPLIVDKAILLYEKHELDQEQKFKDNNHLIQKEKQEEGNPPHKQQHY